MSTSINKPQRVRIFIGSANESRQVARGIKAALEDVGEVRIWDEALFEPGTFTLDELSRFTQSFDFAIFVWSGDDQTVSRGREMKSPRDNVVFEAGMFYAALGKICLPDGRSD